MRAVKVADRGDLRACRADDEVAAGEDCLGGAASLKGDARSSSCLHGEARGSGVPALESAGIIEIQHRNEAHLVLRGALAKR